MKIELMSIEDIPDKMEMFGVEAEHDSLNKMFRFPIPFAWGTILLELEWFSWEHGKVHWNGMARYDGMCGVGSNYQQKVACKTAMESLLIKLDSAKSRLNQAESALSQVLNSLYAEEAANKEDG